MKSVKWLIMDNYPKLLLFFSEFWLYPLNDFSSIPAEDCYCEIRILVFLGWIKASKSETSTCTEIEFGHLNAVGWRASQCGYRHLQHLHGSGRQCTHIRLGECSTGAMACTQFIHFRCTGCSVTIPKSGQLPGKHRKIHIWPRTSKVHSNLSLGWSASHWVCSFCSLPVLHKDTFLLAGFSTFPSLSLEVML